MHKEFIGFILTKHITCDNIVITIYPNMGRCNMHKIKRTMMLGLAMALTVSLLSGCKDEPKEPDTKSVSTSDSAQQEKNEVEKPLLDRQEEIDDLEEVLVAKFDSVEKVEITQEESEYHVKLTFTSPEQTVNEELRDTIINHMVQSYGQLTEEQIIIEVAE